MPIHRQPRLIPVTEAAESTGRSANELRRWCAVGRLRGERIAGERHLLEEDLHVAATLAEMQPRGEQVVVSMAYPDEATARLALDRLAARFTCATQGSPSPRWRSTASTSRSSRAASRSSRSRTSCR